jgi:Zn-dependent peptidase ImmA (M78 family)
MKIPKKVKVGPFIYKVNEDRETAVEGNWGMTSHTNREIFLDPMMSPQTKDLTFLHEVCHVIFHTQGMDTHYDKEEQEKIVNGFAIGLYSFLKENKLNA